MGMRSHWRHPRNGFQIAQKPAVVQDRTHPSTPLPILNLEAGMPGVEEARGRLQRGLDAFHREGRRIIKVIHGYGSSGAGGRLRLALRCSLNLLKSQGAIQDFIAGEDFHDFDSRTVVWIHRCPVLACDYDYDRINKGITIIFM